LRREIYLIFQEFEDEKKKITERDLPKKEDLTLPGWV
jgi:U3 small nucleolar RNA-associated protein 14